MRNRVRIFMSVILSMMMAISGIIVGCSSDDDDETDTPSTPQVQLTATEVNFEKEKSSETIIVSSTVDLTIKSSAEWCLATITGSNGTYSVKIMAMDNADADDRRADVSLYSGETQVATIAVTQKGVGIIENVTSLQMTEKMGFGWNLGNQMDAHDGKVSGETMWGNSKATQALFDSLKVIGVKTVRIPVTWLGHIGEAPTYTIEAAWLDRVAEIVGYAEKAGLNAIINIHHDGGDSKYWLDIKGSATSTAKNDLVKAQISAMWKQIAEKFSKTGDFLIFESFNEIHDGGWGWGANRNDGGKQYATLNEWNQVFVDAVRSVGGENANRWLAVPGYCTNPDLTIEQFVLPKDNVEGRLMVAVHYYDPHEYTLRAEYSEWGHTATKTANYGDEKSMTNTFKKLKEKFVDKNIPCYLGEMGNVNRGEDKAEAFRRYYLEYLCKACKEYGLAPIIWDNGSKGTGTEASGMFERATGKVIRPEYNRGHIEAMVKAIENDDASYTLESVYNTAP